MKTTTQKTAKRRNGQQLLATPLLTDIRLALYGRVSTEDQCDRNTIHGQLEFLRNWARLYDLPISGEYADDGISGTMPLEERPDGTRLLADAKAGHFGTVLVYRVDRFARSLRVLLDSHNELEGLGVAIKSASEPFDSSTPLGKFLFQLLGSMAELERATIVERMTMGRDRVARDGKWTDGPIPFGYEVDADIHLIPSTRLVESMGCTEAQVVQEVFCRIAQGSTALEETRRLNAYGVPTTRYYTNGTAVTMAPYWRQSRLLQMVKNTLYMGQHTYESSHGFITREVPKLVDPATFALVQTQLTMNRRQTKGNATRAYLLRGLIRCRCGCSYVGQVVRPRGKSPFYYYRCGSRLKLEKSELPRCSGKMLQAPWLENIIWSDCADFIRHPGKTLRALQAQLKTRRAQRSTQEDQLATRRRDLASKTREQDDILTLLRRGRISLESADRQLESIKEEEETLRKEIAALEKNQKLTDALDGSLLDIQAMLENLRANIDQIEQDHDVGAMRQIIEQLVEHIDIDTSDNATTGRKEAQILVQYVFRPDVVALTSTPSATGR